MSSPFSAGNAGVPLPSSFFTRDGERFVATALTRGPWSDDAQHGGPPAALLARAIEREAGEAFLARLTVELLRPIPIATFDVRTTVLRPGRKVRLFQASLLHEGVELARATGLALAEAPVALPARAPRTAGLPSPQASAPFEFPFFRNAIGYQSAMEIRVARGRFGEGAMAAWMRMRFPLVAGETPSPLQRVAVAADAGNGISVALDVERYTFINPDLTIHLHRRLAGEWLCLDATTDPEPNGVGLAQTQLSDESGPIGRSLQSLLVSAR